VSDEAVIGFIVGAAGAVIGYAVGNGRLQGRVDALEKSQHDLGNRMVRHDLSLEKQIDDIWSELRQRGK
jgi:hypothetical protein